MKPVRLIVLLGIVLLLFGLVAWQLKGYFLQNKVSFLLNQKQFNEAIALIDRLEKNEPDNPRTDFLQVKTLTISEDFSEALNVAEQSRGPMATPEFMYWRALAEHQLGNAGAARENAQEFIKRGGDLPSGSYKILNALAGETRIFEALDQDALEFRLLFEVEQATYLGLAGQYQLEIGRLDIAAELIRNAFRLGNRNSEFLRSGAKALALVGDVQNAQMFVDFSKDKIIKSLFNDLQSLYMDFQAVSLTLDSDDLARGGRKIDVARAIAWAAGVCLKEKIMTDATSATMLMDSLLAEYPYDPVLQVRKATLLEIIGDNVAAYAVYEEIQQKNPNFMVLVRMLAIRETSGTEFSRSTGKFMHSLNPVISLNPDQLRIEGGEMHEDFVSFSGSGITTATVEVEERGSYMLTVVAKGEQGQEIWPLVEIRIDGDPVGLNYICRNDWDCYNLALPLEGGVHTLELDYENTLKSRGNGNLYLQSIYLTMTGVANVR